MKFAHKFIAEKQLVVVKVTGDYHPRLSGEVIKLIFNAINKDSFNKALFDFREATILFDTLTTYHRASTYIKVGFKRTVKYAYVFNELTDQIHFLETVMQNNGFIFSVFTDYETALGWLLNSKNSYGNSG